MNKWTVAAAALILVATGGVVASQAAATPTYYACVKSGVMSSVGTKKPSCAKGSSMISWGAQGPAGPRGSAGQSGGLRILSEDAKTSFQLLDFSDQIFLLPDGAILQYRDSVQGPEWLATWHLVGGFYYSKPDCTGAVYYAESEYLEKTIGLRAQKLVLGLPEGFPSPPGIQGLYTKKAEANNRYLSSAFWDESEGDYYCDPDDGTVFSSELVGYVPPELGARKFSF